MSPALGQLAPGGDASEVFSPRPDTPASYAESTAAGIDSQVRQLGPGKPLDQA